MEKIDKATSKLGTDIRTAFGQVNISEGTETQKVPVMSFSEGNIYLGLKLVSYYDERKGVHQDPVPKLTASFNGKFVEVPVSGKWWRHFADFTEKFVTGAYIQIGEFTDNGILKRDDYVYGPVICQPERALEILYDKYIPGTYLYDGIFRRSFFRYPQDALREAILNATQHKDYSIPRPIFIRVYPDHIWINNAGDLPTGWDKKMLVGPHTLMPRNPKMALAFYVAGLTEKWGQGIEKILDVCKEAKCQRPKFEIRSKVHEFVVVFEAREIPQSSESVFEPAVPSIELSDVQRSIVELIRGNPRITTSTMAGSLGISQRAVKSNIGKLKEAGLISREGNAKSGSWLIRKDL